jgi:NCS2 family nucleobase:cation symporter-2
MIPLVAPKFFQQLPHWLSSIVDSGILLATIAAVLLNLFFNGEGRAADIHKNALAAAHASEH